MMNDTLTFDTLVDFWREYKTKGESFDIILLTNQEWSLILKATDLDASIKDPLYKEKYDIGRKIAHSLEKKGWKKDATAATYLGIDKNGFLKHLESLFREGMSFENRGEWHLDHVVPLSTAETPEDIKRLWHYTNLQPLWKFENEEKSNLLDWRERFDWAKDVVELRKKRGLE